MRAVLAAQAASFAAQLASLPLHPILRIPGPRAEGLQRDVGRMRNGSQPSGLDGIRLKGSNEKKDFPFPIGAPRNNQTSPAPKASSQARISTDRFCSTCTGCFRPLSKVRISVQPMTGVWATSTIFPAAFSPTWRRGTAAAAIAVDLALRFR